MQDTPPNAPLEEPEVTSQEEGLPDIPADTNPPADEGDAGQPHAS